jgi:pSer/pThr/pTyr-binding forkhead associated (FHA) protein
MLQRECLLVRMEQKQAEPPEPPQESGLARRLRQMRKAPEPTVTEKPQESSPEESQEQAPAAPVVIEPEPTVVRERVRPTPPAPLPEEQVPRLCGLVISATQRLVRLPDDGAVVLGRFEYGYGEPPDIDLTYDDVGVNLVSRHHARLTSREGRHWIEDMQSTNGVYVNEHKVAFKERVQLGRGDKIILGKCQLVYTHLPKWMVEPDPRLPHACVLVITHTGYHIVLPMRKEIMLGRPDLTASYTPDIDLSCAGDISVHVSRKHARLVLHGGRHFLHDVGSITGTRVNGKPLHQGAPPVLLYPGDQIWLGGCVIAYEWKLT